MPELPEVETIRHALEGEVVGLTLQRIEVLERVHLLKNCTPDELKRRLVGQRLHAVIRRGKYLVFRFGDHSIVLHLRMSGRLLLKRALHTRLVLRFSQRKALYFDDARRFGMLYLAESARLNELKPLQELGLEPLSSGYTLDGFKRLANSDQEIKRLLLDQRKVAGLGNIYALEALFEAGIHPERPANSLSSAEINALFAAIPRVLERALEAGGTSFRSYRTPSGELGRFQDEFYVYDRQGEPCRRCGLPIERIVQGGRSSFLCPRCQPASP